MKKILCIALATIMLFSMAACGNKEDVKLSQEPTQSTNQPSTDTNTNTETESKYKYESENMKLINTTINGRIKDYAIDSNMAGGVLSYVLDTDGKLYTLNKWDSNAINTLTDANSRYIFDKLYQYNDVGIKVLALREEYKLHLGGGDTSYYFNPKYTPIFFNNRKSTGQSEGYLGVLSVDEETGKLIYQQCKTDGSINEREISEVSKLQVKQILPGKNTSIFILCEDGKVYKGWLGEYISSLDRLGFGLNQLANDTFGNVQQADRLTNVSRILTNGGSDGKCMVYGDKSKDSSIFMMIDWDKNESLELPLPEGKTVSNIKSVINDPEAKFEDLIVIFDDNSVYYSLKSDAANLKHSEKLSEANKNGTLNNIRIINGELVVLMDDNNLYKITLQ